MIKLKYLILFFVIISLSFNAQEKEITTESKVISFKEVDEIPVFPKCENKVLKEEKVKCFNRGIQKHFAMRFDPNLLSSLNLEPGKKRIFLGFRIDEKGIVDNIRVRAPHLKLEKECKKVLSSLPKMIPAKLNGKPTATLYTFPFTLNITETEAQKKARLRKEKREKKRLEKSKI
ncbi:energy transducer TonB [Polaribacter aquimarinus]|uniref:TonB C-terminal domain-containing protein n=1 Tax=Polaribacter aquimarinus TaxID=2100726 RepID=A0A2U2J719_9FLAO|nr:hypothetical protein [Polaribacter aquimarinus]PWG04117.1 hypothetical protein DIS07_14215 [Polaribacter aquimarinus]